MTLLLPHSPVPRGLWVSLCADRVLCLAPALTPTDAISWADVLYGEHGNTGVNPELVADAFFRKRACSRRVLHKARVKRVTR